MMLQKMVKREKVPILVANGLSMMVGGALALAHSYGAGEVWNPLPIRDGWVFLRYVVAMGLISNVLCYNLYGFLLRRYSAHVYVFCRTGDATICRRSLAGCC